MTIYRFIVLCAAEGLGSYDVSHVFARFRLFVIIRLLALTPAPLHPGAGLTNSFITGCISAFMGFRRGVSLVVKLYRGLVFVYGTDSYLKQFQIAI